MGDLRIELDIAADMAKILERDIDVSNKDLDVTIYVCWESDYEGTGPRYDYEPPYDPNAAVSVYDSEDIVSLFPNNMDGWMAGDKDERAIFKKEVNRLKRLCKNL